MSAQQTITKLLHEQPLAVLATYGQGQPYASLVAFACGAALDLLVFATLRATRKFANLQANPRVALFVDDRTAPDGGQTSALTVLGKTSEAMGQQRDALAGLLLARHPDLQAFLQNPDCAIVQVQAERFVLASGIERVVTLDAPFLKP